MSEHLRRYDMNLYKDRWMHFYRTTSPKHLFVSDKQVRDAQQMIKNFEDDPNWLPAKYLWKAQEIVDAVSHPVTKELLFKPFSWAGFLPANVPILCGLIFTQRTTFNIIFWQWINQSYNSAVNYTYLNPNEPASYSSLLMSYIGAVSVSVFAGLKLSGLYERNKDRLKEPIKTMARFSTPYIAVASAGVINLLITRASEGYNGLPLEDEFGAKVYKNSKTGQCVVSQIKEDGNEEYLNQLAGIRSVFQGAATRAFIPFGLIYVPPIMKEIALKFRMWPKSVTAAKLLEIGLITGVILYALPSSIAAFPPKATIPIQKLGPEFDDLRKAGVKTLYFDRSIQINMVETVSDLHNDLKICNQKSILLTASLEQAQGILFGTGIRQESRTRVLGKLKQGRALQDVFHDKKDPAKSKTFHNDEEEDSSDSEEVRLIRRPRPPVNPQLRQTISQLSTRVNRIKNGKSSNAQLLTREAQMPRALQHFRENRRSQNLTPDPGRRSVSPMFMTETDSSRISSKSPLLQSSTTLSTYRDKSATPPLPHISLTSGKTQDPLKLPTFDEFCTQQQLILSEGPSKEKAFQKIQNTGKILGNLKTELSGLEYYLTANRGVPWNGDKGLLRELEKHPIQRKELLRKYNKKFVNRMRTKRTGSLIKRASTIGQRFSVLRKGRKRMGILPQVEMNAAIADMINPENYIDEEQEVISSEQLINSKLARLAQNKIYDLKEEKPELEQIEQKVKNLRQAKNCLTTATNEFIKSKDDQNQRLNAILQRLEQDRPTNTSKKIQLIRSDKSQYTTHGHSLNKFASFKRKIQSEKKMILQENKEQEQLYEEMLEHLKQQNTYPSEDEEGYLLLIKELLEEGIAITEHEFYLILESFDVHSIPGSRLEKLISVVREWIGIVPVEWYGWLKRQGVILPSNILRKYKHLRNISVKQ